MDTVKAILSILICLALLAAEVTAMGLFSAKAALSGNHIEAMVAETVADPEIIDRILDDVLGGDMVDVDGVYGDLIMRIMKTDAMTGYFTEYVTYVVNTRVYGETAEELPADALSGAFARAIDEVSTAEGYPIPDELVARMSQAMEDEAAALMEKMDQQVSSYAEILGGDEDESASVIGKLNRLLEKGVETKALIASVVLCILLIVLNWRSRFGFLWCGVITLITAVLYWGMSFLGAEKIISYMFHTTDVPGAVLLAITDGLQTTAIYGSIVAAACFILFAVFKIVDRRRA